ncbi:MAG TPA: protein YgfX [Burkholderiales bacterium]|nr:protein YgfX [Burkholderiales bacterium]
MIIQRVKVAPSVLIAIAISVVHLAAAAVLWLVPIPILGKAVFTFVIAVSLIYFMARDAALHAAHSIVTLELGEDGEVACQTRGGEWLDCELLGSSYVSPHMTIVNIRPRGWWKSRRVILVPDNVDHRDFRRLRMWLRWKSGESHESAQPAD